MLANVKYTKFPKNVDITKRINNFILKYISKIINRLIEQILNFCKAVKLLIKKTLDFKYNITNLQKKT